jgi:hypothetical protein
VSVMPENQSTTGDVVDLLLEQHEKIGIDGEGFDAQLETVRLAVLDHAAAEKREVFPLLRQSMDAETLRSMRNALEAAEAMAPTHPHPHGPESAIGNLIVGPFVAVVDKVRDALPSGKAS